MSANEDLARPAHSSLSTRTLPTSPIRETYQLPTHPGLRVNDTGNRPGSIGSIGSNGPRTSVFLEHSEDLEPQPMPPHWNRDSQSAYRASRNFSHPRRAGQSNLSISTYGTSEDAKSPSPTTFAYEMPQRYRGKGIEHDDYVGHPLASDMNSWAPPPPDEKTMCVLPRKRMLWVLVGIVCILILVGVIGGIIGGISAMNKSSESNPDTTSAIAISTQTSIASRTSSVTLPNGSVVLTTMVITSVQTIQPKTTSTQPQSLASSESSPYGSSSPASSTLASSSASSSLSTSSPSASLTSTSSIQPTTPSSPTSQAASSSIPTSIASVPLLTLDCPGINDTNATDTISGKEYVFSISCNTDFRSADLSVVIATSIADCYSACAQYSSTNILPCFGVTFNANTTAAGSAGNCNLRQSVDSSFSTGDSNTIAAAIYQP